MSAESIGLLDHLTTAVIQVDADGQILYSNAQAEQLFHKSREKLKNQFITELFEEQQDNGKSFASALIEDIPFIKREAVWRIIHASYSVNDQDDTRSLRHVDYSLTPIDENSTLIEINDLSRLSKISRDGVNYSIYELSQNLIRGLAHEIKNPLGGIRGSAQLLERIKCETDIREYTDIIISETDRLKVLVDRMLGPKRKIHFEEQNIHQITERIFQIINLEYRDRIKLKRDYDISIPELLCDEGMLVQSFLNIARNAAQALSTAISSNENSKPSDQSTQLREITFRTRIERNFTIGQAFHRLVAMVQIIDNGPGIPEEIIDEIFFPMISGRADGTGLGLAITQEIISSHKGTIEVSSAPGRTVFTTYLPLHVH